MNESPEPGHSPEPASTADAIYALLSTVSRRAPRERSLTALATLATLARTGPRRITDLAAIEGVTQPSVTALVTALERDGLVERRSDPSDKRVALVALTPAGLDYTRNRRQASTTSLAQLIDKLPADEAATLTAAVPALLHLHDLDNQEREPTSRATRTARAGSNQPRLRR
ncbi:MAG TPA: MarR family transcriptional regulator [Jatrophihabitantaceae bacterium]|jgi:DNA-binding MarR family transcriptional regulator|nr:MarR family transcriptional regulator [Jatrophihabitantaceae bacterium]